MELIKTYEVIGNVAEKIYHAGKFVVERFQGGAWGSLPHGEREARPTITLPKAHIEYFPPKEAE